MRGSRWDGGWGIGGGTAVTAGSVYRVTQGYPSVLPPLAQYLPPFMIVYLLLLEDGCVILSVAKEQLKVPSVLSSQSQT